MGNQYAKGHVCMMCGRRMEKNREVLCVPCMDAMREFMGITAKEVLRARERGFFRPHDLACKLDDAMRGLDRI